MPYFASTSLPSGLRRALRRLRWAAMGQLRNARVQLTAVIGVILLVGFLATDLISFRVSTATLRDAILHDELPLTSNNIYSDIQADLLRPILVSSLMAHDTFVRDWLLGGERDVPAITRYLEEIHQRYGVFSAFLVSDRTRNYYHFSGLARTVDEGDPADGWFPAARAMTQPYAVNVDADKVTGGTITIFINYRVLDYNNHFIGLTGVGLRLDTVARIIARYHARYQRNIYFVDASGKILVRSPDAAITEDSIRSAPGLASRADKLLGMDEGYMEYRRGGEAMLLTTRLIPDLGWHVIVEQKESDAFAGLWRGFLLNAALGLGVIAVIIAIVGYAVNIYQRRLEAMATHDKLTGLGNRHLFDAEFGRLMREWRDGGQGFCVLLFDIDHFKQVNDTLGHLKGDEVIVRIAALTRDLVRRPKLVCRWGGEEIVILLQHANAAEAREVAELLRAGIAAAPLFPVDDGTRVTVSIGVTDLAPGEAEDAVLQRLDAALYEAKRGGRDRVVFAAA